MGNNGCPECGSPVDLKEGKYGLFYGCSKFPECRFTANFELFGGDAFDSDYWREVKEGLTVGQMCTECMNS